jgi:arylsulfatase A-like enzyme
MPFADLPRKPNILMIVTDQEREVMHWPAGWADANLPARSRLMAHGLHFTRAHCNAAACSPSRATLLTGLYPAQHGVKSVIQCDDPGNRLQRHLNLLPSHLPNIGTVMAAAGYHVVFKGKFHLSRPVNYNRERKQFYWSDDDIAHMAERYGFHGWNPPDMSAPQGLHDLGGGSINNDGRFVDGTGTSAGEVRPYDELYRQSAVHFLRSYDGDKPFLLIVCLVNPHDVQEYPGRGVRGIAIKPTYVQGGYRLEDFASLPIDLPASVDDDLSTKPSVHADFRKLLAIGTGHVRTRQRQLTYARFYAYLNQQVDAQIAKLLDALDERGLTNDTIVIRTSDHGELGMAHGRMRQKFFNAYRESLSIPLIVSNPRLFPKPQSTPSFAGLIDVLPTLTAMGSVPEPDRYGFKGRDLTPILIDPKRSVQDFLHFTYEDDALPLKGATCIRALVEDGWKYAVYYDPFTGAPTEYEQYDLTRDPLEIRNLAHASHATPESETERTRLHARLADVMKTCGTYPDEIRWPESADFRPKAALANSDENGGLDD